MPRDPEPTRQRILDAALALFAEQGISGTSQREIRIAAGQRNVNAVAYHFGDQHEVLTALLDRERPALLARRAELLDEIVDARSAAAVIVLPFAELATGTEHERQVVRFIARLYEEPSFDLARVTGLVKQNANDQAYHRLEEYLPEIPAAVLRERVVVGIGAFLHAAASRARGVRRSESSAIAFRELVVDMFIGGLVAPVLVDAVR